jgi:hypothetical protein
VALSAEQARERCRNWHREKYRSDPAWAKARNERVKEWTRKRKAEGGCTKCAEPATHSTLCGSHFWLGRVANWKKRGIAITLEQFFARLKAQGNACPLCARALNAVDAVVDHCHETGQVRGVLCVRCNSAIGALGDTARSVARVVAYLEARR